MSRWNFKLKKLAYISTTAAGLSAAMAGFSTQASSNEFLDRNVISCLSITGSLDESVALLNCQLAISKTKDEDLKTKLLLSRAHIYAATGKYNKAKADIEKAQALLPNSALTNLRMAELVQFKNPSLAKELFEKALETAKPNEVRVIKTKFSSFLLLSSRAASQKGQYNEAISLLDTLIAKTDDDLSTHKYLSFRGRINARKGDEQAGLKDWADAIKKTPQYPWAYVARGLYHISKSDRKAALDDLNAAYERKDAVGNFVFPKRRYITLLKEQAVQFLEQNDLFSVVNTYKRISDIGGKSEFDSLHSFFTAKISQNLASQNTQQAKLDTRLAVSVFRELGSLFHEIDFELRLASLLLDTADKKGARDVIQKAYNRLITIQKDGTNNVDNLSGLFVRLTINQLKLGELEKAIASSEAALNSIKSDHEKQKTAEALGDAWFFIGAKSNPNLAYKTAKIVFGKALSNKLSKHRRFNVHLKLAKVKSALNNNQEAVELLDSAITEIPSSVIARSERAKIFEKLGNIDAAQKAYEEALSISRTSPEKFDLHMRLAKVHEKRRDKTLLLHHLNQANALNPNDAILNYQLGMLHISNSDNHEAMLSLNKALALDGTFLNARFARGKLLLSQQRYGKALEDLKLYVANEEKISPTDSYQARFFSAIALFNLNKIKEADQVFTALLGVQKEEPLLSLWLAKTSLRLGKGEQAVKFFDNSMSNFSTNNVAEYQAVLKQKGYDVGTIDGVYGPSTKKAIVLCVRNKCL